MPNQSTAGLRYSREDRQQAWFGDGRHWRVCGEITGNRIKDGFKVFYFRGFFQVAPPGVFQTPFGYKGRSGYLIQETDAEGKDLPGTAPQTFGRMALARANNIHHSVTGLPERDPRRHDARWIA